MTRLGVLGFSLAVVMGLGADAAKAAITYTASGKNDDKLDFSVKAEFSVSGTDLIVKLTNLTTNTKAVNQALSGVIVNFASTSGITNSVVTGAGSLVMAGPSGNTAAPVGANKDWTNTLTGTSMKLSSLDGIEGALPLIIGPDPYNANGSIPSHNPFFDETATFTLKNYNGAEISSLSFQLGSNKDKNTFVGIRAVPEPATFILGASALVIGLGVNAMRRRKRNQAEVVG